MTPIINFIVVHRASLRNSEDSRTKVDLERIVQLESVSVTIANRAVALSCIHKICSNTNLSIKLLLPCKSSKVVYMQMSWSNKINLANIKLLSLIILPQKLVVSKVT